MDFLGYSDIFNFIISTTYTVLNPCQEGGVCTVLEKDTPLERLIFDMGTKKAETQQNNVE